MNEVTMKDPTALAEVPMDLATLAADAELGGKLGLRDIAVPYLYILQQNSPQINSDHAKYIKGAAAGMLYLTNLELVFEGREVGVDIVPCYFEALATEWLPREQGGGLIASHSMDSPIIEKAERNDRNQLFLKNGHQIVETAYHYVLVRRPDTGAWIQAIMPMKSTALKVSRRMNSTIATTMVQGTTTLAPRFLYTWKLTTVRETKDQYVFSSPKLIMGPMVNKPIYDSARAYAIISSKGLLRRIAAEAEAAEITKAVVDDEIPF